MLNTRRIVIRALTFSLDPYQRELLAGILPPRSTEAVGERPVGALSVRFLDFDDHQ